MTMNCFLLTLFNFGSILVATGRRRFPKIFGGEFLLVGGIEFKVSGDIPMFSVCFSLVFFVSLQFLYSPNNLILSMLTYASLLLRKRGGVQKTHSLITC